MFTKIEQIKNGYKLSVIYRYYKYYVLIAILFTCMYYTITGRFTDLVLISYIDVL